MYEEQALSIVANKHATTAELCAAGSWLVWQCWQPEAPGQRRITANHRVQFLDAGQLALEKVVATQNLSSPAEINNYYGAWRHTTHAPLYRHWARIPLQETETVALSRGDQQHQAIRRVHALSAPLLEDLVDKFDQRFEPLNPFLDKLICTTLGMLLSRRQNANRLSLPSTPATQRWWWGPGRRRYPPCNSTIMTTSARLLPAIVRITPGNVASRTPGINYYGLGIGAVEATDNLPTIRNQLPSRSTGSERLHAAIRLAARFILEEVAGESLDDKPEGRFLDIIGADIVEWIDDAGNRARTRGLTRGRSPRPHSN